MGYYQAPAAPTRRIFGEKVSVYWENCLVFSLELWSFILGEWGRASGHNLHRMHCGHDAQSPTREQDSRGNINCINKIERNLLLELVQFLVPPSAVGECAELSSLHPPARITASSWLHPPPHHITRDILGCIMNEIFGASDLPIKLCIFEFSFSLSHRFH